MQHGSVEALRNEVHVLRRELEKWRRYALLQEMIANVAYYQKKCAQLESEVASLKLAALVAASLGPCMVCGGPSMSIGVFTDTGETYRRCTKHPARGPEGKRAVDYEREKGRPVFDVTPPPMEWDATDDLRARVEQAQGIAEAEVGDDGGEG